MRRQKARETAFLLLYRIDMGGLSLDQAVECIDQRPDADIWRLAMEMVESTLANQPSIDEKIQRHTPSWGLERIASPERSILRLTVGELLVLRDAPDRVIIDQALKLAEKFGGPASAHFVHAILGAILREKHEGSAHQC